VNFVVSILNRSAAETAAALCREISAPVVLVTHARGTATQEMLDLLGIEAQEKSVVVAIASEERTRELIRIEKKKLYLDVPGNGLVVAVPIKSVGGGKTLAYLSENAQVGKKAPDINPDFELVVAIINEGYTDQVMDLARQAGAAGGTVIRARGTGSRECGKFLGVSIAQEKELVFIISRAAEKAEIMRAVVRGAGPESKAGAVVFSLPVSDIAGLRLLED